MVVKRGKPVRPILVGGVFDKRFKRGSLEMRGLDKSVLSTEPGLVALDLSRGSLASFDKYLTKNPGLLDRRIALELRKLISGRASRSKYRLVVIDHPNAAKAKGGKEVNSDQKRWERDEAIVRLYDGLIADGTKPYIAEQDAASAFKISPRTVARILKSLDRSRLDKRSSERIRELREEALAKLRLRSSDQ